MRKLLALIVGILGLLLAFAGFGLITFSQNFLLYLGLALLLLAVILFARG